MAFLSSSQAKAKTEGGATRGGWTRWEPVTGIAFVVLFVASFATGSNPPDANASDRKWIDFFASSGHQISMVVSGFLLVLASLCLLSFLVTVWSRVAAARRPEATSPLALVAAGVAAAALALGGVMNAVIAGGMIFGKLPEPRPDILRIFTQISFPMIAVAGMITLALAIACLGVEARRAEVVGKGLMIFSLVVAVVALFSFVFFPILLVMVWFLVASVAIYRRQARVVAEQAQPVPATQAR